MICGRHEVGSLLHPRRPDPLQDRPRHLFHLSLPVGVAATLTRCNSSPSMVTTPSCWLGPVTVAGRSPGTAGESTLNVTLTVQSVFTSYLKSRYFPFETTPKKFAMMVPVALPLPSKLFQLTISKGNGAALQIDDRLADAHASLGLPSLSFEYDWRTAETELRRALELNPAHAFAHLWYAGGVLAALGRLDEAHILQRRAYELDPVSPSVICGAAADLIFHGRCDGALPFLERALELQPEFPMTYYWLGEAYLLKGDYEQVETLCRRVLAPHVTAGFLGHCYARTGRVDEARRLLRELESIQPGQPSPALQVAVLHLGLGDHGAAIAALDQARQRGCLGIHWLATDPLWEPLRGDPGFVGILRRMNLVPPERQP